MNAPRILIVDDSEDDGLLAASRLKRALPDADCERVDTPEGMAAALDSHDWDVIICDHSMPRFDSMRALQMVRAHGMDTPFIVYSGHYDRHLGDDALKAGATDIVQKTDPARLVPVVTRELSRRTPGGPGRVEPHFDAVTGLPSRDWLLAQLEARIESHRESGAGLALLHVALDRFNRIEHAYGSPAARALLKQVCARLQRELGSSDLLARAGDHDFLALLDRFEEPRLAQRRAERLMRAFDEPFENGGNTFYVTASGGLGLHAPGGDTTALCEAAARALERAKARGINRFEQQRVEPAPPPAAEPQPAESVPPAELFLLAHPIVALPNRRLVGLEVVARRQHPQLGLLAPDLAAPIAGPQGGVVASWLLAETLDFASLLRKNHPELKLALNLSRWIASDPDAPRELLDTFAADPSKAASFEIALGERWVLAQPDRAAALAQELHASGLQVALDEFGTTYGPLAPLHSLEVDTLKLSASLVREPSGSGRNAALEGAVAFGRALGAGVLARGVQSDVQVARLASLGVTHAQGPLFPPRSASTWLAASDATEGSLQAAG